MVYDGTHLFLDSTIQTLTDPDLVLAKIDPSNGDVISANFIANMKYNGFNRQDGLAFKENELF